MANWDILHVNTLEVDHGVNESEIRQAIAEGRLSRDDCVRRAGEERWWRIYERTEFRASGAEPATTDEPPHLEEGSLRNLLQDAEPPQDLSRPRRRAFLPTPTPTPTPILPPRPQPQAPVTAVAPPPATAAAPPEAKTPELLTFAKRRVRGDEEMDMAPAATISFLLILFFVIVSGVALQMAIAFPKPDPDDQAQAKPDIVQKLEDLNKDNIVVDIKADNTISIDKEPVKESELLHKITTLKRDRAITGLVVNADYAAYHETVVAVVDAASKAGIQKIKMASVTKVTKKPSKKRAVKK